MRSRNTSHMHREGGIEAKHEHGPKMSPEQHQALEEISQSFGFESPRDLFQAVKQGKISQDQVDAAFQARGLETPKPQHPHKHRDESNESKEASSKLLEALAKSLGFNSVEELKAALGTGNSELKPMDILKAVEQLLASQDEKATLTPPPANNVKQPAGTSLFVAA